MKKIIILLITLSTFTTAAAEHIGAFGTELGVARLSDGKNSGIGTSWLFHTEYQIDSILGFFAQAGKADAKSGSDHFTQTAFNGGIQLDLLPVLEFRLGIASTVLEIKDSASIKRETELGPMAGLTAFAPLGVWKLGASAAIIKTGSLQSAAMRGMLLLMF